MRIDILTIFPEMFVGPFDESILKRAQDKSLVKINIHNLRGWAKDKHKTVDDRPYGGGPGMIMMVEPIDLALQEIRGKSKKQRVKTILLSAKGGKYSQQQAKKLSKSNQLIIICGHYEGVDQRVADHLADEVISIGDFVLTGGELAAMVVVDSVVRLLPGVIGKTQSLKEESHNQPGYIEYPQYTRPENYKGWNVPKVLVSGNHKEIDRWKKDQTVK